MTLQTPPLVLRIIPQRTQYNRKTHITIKNNPRTEIPSEYSFKFPEDMADVTHSLVSVHCYYDGTSNKNSHYLCDILDFNNGISWRCDDDTITKFR